MASENSAKVVSSIWGSGQNFSDFVPVKYFIAPDPHKGIFTDTDASTARKIGIQVTEEFYLPDDGTPMAKNHVTVKNISGGPLVDVSAGYFFDWDIGDAAGLNETGLYTDVKSESQDGVAVGQYASHRDESEFPFYGSAVYTEDENAVPQAAGLNYDITGGFSVSDQIDALNSGTSWQIGGIDDISYVVGMKFPGVLPYEGIVEFDLCFGCGDELSHLAYNWRKCVRPDYITSVNKIAPEKLEMSISPNPASEVFSVKIMTPDAGDMSITITDIFGNEQYAQDITAPSGINTLNLSAGGFSSGIYFVRALIAGSSVSAKLVIVR